jgi:class 3 adenylate cyclase
MMLGTVAYMPPEQALGRQADARSDLYSWGCVLYEMVTGRPPFLGDDTVAIISQHINTAPVAPSWHNPEVPRTLEALIMRCLAKDPDERPESAAALPEALSAVMTAAPAAAKQTAEEVNPLDRLAGGVFVGREKEMDELRAGLEEALSGKGRLLMLVGEPGIGKTRTSEELATYAGLRNAQVLWGKCYEGEGAPAYWPWVQVIRSYVHDREPKELMSEMGPGAADIAQVVSEVKERLPGLPEPPALEPEQARFRLFDSITTFLKNASKGQPIVLVLDDLHWADKPSLLLLQFLARELRGSRLMVLATYRDVELRRGHPLADALGELAREGLSQRILLRGLTDRDVARFIEITAGITPPEALVTAVYRETEGNPFFVNEIVRLLVADGRLERPEEVKSWSVTIPQGVREVVGRRLDHLSEDCNSVLTIASVIGREFGLDAMERVSDVTGDRLLEVLEEAVGARVVAEVPRTAGRYSFTHALIRETLYEELSTARRVRLHRQIGEVLEGLHREALDPHLAELAHHFSEAAPGGDVDKAIDYARRAGERAAALLAYEEAAELYGLALQALDLREATDEDQRCELMLARGEALNSAGSRDQARGIFEAAAGISRELGRPDKQARAALGFAGPWGEYGTADTVAITLLEEALAGLGSEDSTLRVRVLARLSWELFYALEREPSEECSRQALEIAQRVGDPRALGDALWRRQAAYHRPAEVQKRLQIGDDLLQAARDSGDGWPAHYGHWVRMEVMMQLGDIQAVDVEIERHAQEAQESRLPSLIGFSALLRALRALLEGRFEEAERLGREAFALGQRAQDPLLAQNYLIQLMVLRWSQGRLDEMEALVRAGAQQSPDVPVFRAILAMTYADLGREEQAKVEFEGLAVDDFSNLPSDSNLPLTLAYLAVAADFLNDARRAAALYDLLLPYAGHNIIVGAGAACLGSASRSLGILATTMGRWEDAEKHFGDALEMNASMGARPLVAWTQHDHANMLLRRDEPGDREKSLELVSEALNAAQDMGMKALVEKALALKLRAQGIDTSDVQSSIDAVAAVVQSEHPDLRQHAAPDGTVTILFSDIEGSTEMTERLGDQRWLDVLHEHNAIIRRQVSECGGFEVKAEGDGFMLAFGSARTALGCAIEMQRALAKRNDGAEEPIKVRIGLHTGEAIKEGEDFFGKHVILAARIAGQASGGQILVSSLLRELTESAGDVEFGEGREVELKGLVGTHRVYEVAW